MKLSPSQFTKFEESKGEWIGYIMGLDKWNRDCFFTVGTVTHAMIEGYNRHGVRHLEDIDKHIQEDLKKNKVENLSQEEMDKIRTEITFAVENYMMSNPERHDQPEQYIESKMFGHIIRGYVDAVGVDYKSVSNFCKLDETTRNGITTYTKYRIGALIYSVLLHDNNIKIDKYRYIEILKTDGSIKENTTYTIDKLIEIIKAQGVTDNLEGLQKKQLVNLYAPRKETVKVIEFDVTPEFLDEGRKYIEATSAEMVKTIELIGQDLTKKLL